MVKIGADFILSQFIGNLAGGAAAANINYTRAFYFFQGIKQIAHFVFNRANQVIQVFTLKRNLQHIFLLKPKFILNVVGNPHSGSSC